MSYINNLLQQQDKSLVATLDDVDYEISNLKGILLEKVESTHISLRPHAAQNEKLVSRADIFKSRLEEINCKLNNNLKVKLEDSSQKMKNLTRSLKDVNCFFDILNRIIEIFTEIKLANECLKQLKFLECGKKLEGIKDKMKLLDDFECLKFVSHMRQETTILRETLLFSMAESWSTIVTLTVNKDEGNVCVSLTLDRKNELLLEIVETTFLISDSFLQRKFYQKLKDQIFLPLVVSKSTLKICDNELIVTFNNEGKEHNYSQVFEKIITVVKFLKNHLNFITSKDTEFITEIGNAIGDDLISKITKDLLSNTSPTENDCIDGISEVMVKAENFHRDLQTLGFLLLNESSSISGAEEINILFANKIYLSFLDKARSIMKGDLHNITDSARRDISDWKSFPEPIVEAIAFHFYINGDKCVELPSLKISVSANEVILLTETIIAEISKSEEIRAIRLMFTVRNIFEAYSAIVPLHHKKLLRTIPQQAAIFHNNCLHLSHTLLELACQCKRSWPGYLKEHYHIFLDEAASLRNLAVNSLQACISSQQKQLISILQCSGLGKLPHTQKLDEGTEKAVRQCVRQLQILRNVWVDILPSKVFSNTMGFLIDSVTEAIVCLVLVVEDISSTTASELVDIFQIVIQRLPSLFDEPKEVHRLCRKWGRFNELVLMLNGSLNSISDRWADGAGPLACEFAADQVKQIIRAIFQNTERRAATISRIK